MRRLFALIMTLIMVLSLCACAGKAPDGETVPSGEALPDRVSVPVLDKLHLTAQNMDTVVYSRDGLEITVTGGEVSNKHCLLYFHVKNNTGKDGADLTAADTILDGRSLHAGAWSNEKTDEPVGKGAEGVRAVCFWGDYLENFYNAEFECLTATARIRLDGEVIAEIPLQVDGQVFAGDLAEHTKTVRYREISFAVPESWTAQMNENGSITILRFDAADLADYGLCQVWTIDMNSFVSWQYQILRENLLILRTYNDETVPDNMKLLLKDKIFGAQKNVYEKLEELMKKVIAPDMPLGEIERIDLGERLAIATEFVTEVSGYDYAGRIYMTADGDTITAFSVTARGEIGNLLDNAFDYMIESLHYNVAPIFPEGVPAE